MKKLSWMLAIAAVVGLGLAQRGLAQDKAPADHARPVAKTLSGTIKVAGDVIKLVAEDGEYVLKSREPKILEAYKAKDGQKAEIKGFVREKDGVKTLFVFGGHGGGHWGHGGHGKKGDTPPPATPPATPPVTPPANP